MDVQFIIQCVGEGEEAVGVEEVVAFKLVGKVRNLAFFGAHIHSGRGHNNFDYRKQSRRTIGISLVVR